MLWTIIGDLDYFAATLQLPRFSLMSGPCPLCRCTGHGDRSWTVFGVNAEWRNHIWTTADWLNWDARSPCPLFSGEDGITALAVGLDWLHCKYLGTDMYVYGSILKLLCFFMLPSSPIDNLQTVWGDIKSFYKALGTPVRYRYITKLTMFIPAKNRIRNYVERGPRSSISPM